MPKFILPGAKGLLVKGNIDIDARSFVAVPVGGGAFASVRSTSWELRQPELRQRTGLTREAAEVLVPEIIRVGHKWVAVTGSHSLAHYRKTGRHLGIFDTAGNATAYATRLHLQQAGAAKKRIQQRRQRVRR
jgi:hypothetical protein